jgi:hypothetical protein
MNERKYYLSNAFSINMISHLLNDKYYIHLKIRKLTINEVKNFLNNNIFTSIVGHESTASFLSKILNIEIPVNRIPIKLNPNDLLIVAILNVRLPEGKILTLEELEEYKKNLEFVLVEI